MKPTYLLAALLLLFSGQAAFAQHAIPEKVRKEETTKQETKVKQKEKKGKKPKKSKAGKHSDEVTGKPAQDKPNYGQRPETVGKPKVKITGPRKLNGVPPGHFPPPGQCRVWYPNRPPGHQPPPVACHSLVGVKLEPGAFILHGDKAYDAGYDWRAEEKRKPGTVAREILDILFPPSR